MSDEVSLKIADLDIKISVSDILKANNDKYFTTYYMKNDDSLLNQLCDKYGSDKGEIAESGHP